MTWLQIIVLAVIQGLTEFLPISSSGHLVLMPNLAGWADQGLVFDVAVHFGSLIAVCVFFREDIAGLLRGGMGLLGGQSTELERRMALGIGLGTVPAAVAGLLFAGWIEANLRDPLVVVTTLAAYGVLMAVADRYGRRARIIADIKLGDAMIIGCAQALALIPGTSRSGVTITAGLALGLQRRDAARFSFLLSAPVILLASGYEFIGMLLSEDTISWGQLAVGAAISAVVAYLSIDFFMRFVNRIGLLPFAIYRLLLAGLILYALA
ncbi:MAG: undecaprenyl-diphosphate phosphatase [Gammaproteobacteria bacterium]|nr:undecaprenyl-diphosphate phosphatase [Gammaproteobacteria bacterium]MDH4253234.1 undecaprenyl-diphosphate phosphatase [Gammaproteobacteria bacterium]MDH5308987.1 undecaprenyl-diphosphate phosphatase [Gammaproteobacteria bacterium]